MRYLALTAAWLVLGGCSSSTSAPNQSATDNNPDSGSGSSTDAAHTSFVASYCAAVNPCCATKNVSACNSNLIRYLDVGFTSAIGNACLAAVSKPTDVCAVGWQIAPACHRAFGLESASAVVAAKGATCDGTIAPSGSFTALAVGPSMTACDGSTTYCSPTTKTCTPVVALGGACDGASDAQCGVTAYCDLDTSTCLAKKAEGATCTLSDDCISGVCTGKACGSLANGPNNVAGSGWSPVCYAN
jgi:hypothetical protein